MIDGPLQRPFLAARDAGADEEDALLLQRLGAPGRVGVVGVAAVDQDVARLEQRDELVDDLDRPAAPALTMIMIFRGRLSAATSSLTEWQPTIFLPLARPARKSSTLRRGAVEHGDGEAVALHVQDEVLAHHGQADQADVGSRARSAHAVKS